MFSHLSVGYRGKNKAHVVWSGSREPLWKLLWNRCAINVDCRLADWQVNGVNIAVKCSNRFSIPKTSLLDNHIKHTVSGCYATLSILRKLKYIAKYELRKQLAETLILSKLDYADLVFYPLPQFLLRRLQRVQFAAASFVLGHYVKNFRDVRKIGWLPINERRDLNVLKSCFKALHNTETWPDYLKIIKQECRKELRSSNSIRLVAPTENELKRHFQRWYVEAI